MYCNVESESLEGILATIGEHAKREVKLMVFITKTESGFRLVMNTIPASEPEVTPLSF